jgi:hypothetical protein
MINRIKFNQVKNPWELRNNTATSKEEKRKDCLKAALTDLKANSCFRQVNLIKNPTMEAVPIMERNREV